MKKYFVAILSLLLTISLVACSDSSNNQDSNTTNSEETTDKNTKTATNELGTRSNPYPFNTPSEISKTGYDDDGNEFTVSLDITVLSSERGESAYQKLKEADESNEAAPEGYEWALLEINIAFTDTDNENEALHISEYDFTLVSESGDIYSGDIYASNPEPELEFEMYSGNEKTGYAAYLVKEGEGAVLRLGDNLFFAIE